MSLCPRMLKDSDLQLEDIALLEQERPKCRLWLPQVPLVKFFTGIWEQQHIDIDREEDEDPGTPAVLPLHWLTCLSSFVNG